MKALQPTGYRLKVISAAVGTALFTLSAGTAVAAQIDPVSVNDLKVSAQTSAISGAVVTNQNQKSADTYIIQLSDPAVSQYKGTARVPAAAPAVRSLTPGIRSLVPGVPSATGKIDLHSKETQKYVAYLKSQQSKVLAALGKGGLSPMARSAAPVSGSNDVLYQYQYAFNGMTIKMSPAEAQFARTLPGVKHVSKDYSTMPSSDRGPNYIGAPSIWSGEAGGIPAEGEGMVIGIIDTGINHDHPSFAEAGDDGYGAGGEYAATNPFGPGGFAGGVNDDCSDPTFSGLCNNKLIGSYSYMEAQAGDTDVLTQPGDPVSKDTDGHGSHVASTAGGNRLAMPPLLDADSNDTGLSLGMVSGVAPHAHVIAYKVCAPSCFASDIVAAVDQAILDGADALNHSIGAAPGSPWIDAKAQAFLAARDAGIMVQNSAGNSGPEAATAARINAAPWATAVAATTHDRAFPLKTLDDLSGGDTPPPESIIGRSVTDGISGNLVYAGDYSVGESGDANFDTPEQCLEPFPPETFSPNDIVVCDRGAIARVQKGRNVRDGGAAGLILANTDGGATSINDDTHVIPAIHIDAASGNELRSWLAGGSSHSGSISGTGPALSDPALADIMADFSSRGPYSDFDMLTPHVAAPGVSIYAAGANLAFEHPGLATADPNDDPSVAAEYGIIGGTSMASPHATGSAILLSQTHPDWSPAEVKSALMTTGVTSLRKEDGVTPADVFDFGGGRINLADAARVGLLMDETTANFVAADPAIGGEPKDLNMPGLVDESCAPSCSWTRTVTNATGSEVSWDANTIASPGMVLSVEPASFSLLPGQSQSLTVNADVSAGEENGWHFGQVQLSAMEADLPEQHLSVAALFTTASSPQAFSKSVDLEEAGNGEVVTYTLSLTNLGDEDTFSVIDTLPEGLIYVPASANEDISDGMTSSPFAYDGESHSLSWQGTLGSQTLAIFEAGITGYMPLADFGFEPLGCPSNCDDGAFIINGLDIHYLGEHYTEAIMSINGTLELGRASGNAAFYVNAQLPDVANPNNRLAPMWADHNLNFGGEWYTGILSGGGSSYFVASWENVGNYDGNTYSFQIWMEQGTSNIWFTYGELPETLGAATVGFEDASGTSGASYYFNGTGSMPAVGTDLLVAAIPGGSATLTFQAQVDAAVGDLLTNTAEADSSSISNNAIAVTRVILRDEDGDGIGDNMDNCITVANPGQCDSDHDGFGNACDADLDNSGFVNFSDMVQLMRSRGQSSDAPDYHAADLNCDGEVGLADQQMFKTLFNKPPGPAAMTGS